MVRILVDNVSSGEGYQRLRPFSFVICIHDRSQQYKLQPIHTKLVILLSGRSQNTTFWSQIAQNQALIQTHMGSATKVI